MRLQIQNIGKIKYANLKLDGITVIAGNNNTGKSTVGKTVFALFNALFRIEEKLYKQREKLIYTMLNRKLDDLFMHQDKHYGISYGSAKLCSRELVNVRDAAEQRRIIESMLKMIRVEENETILSEILEEVNRINDLPDERLVRKSVTDFYTDVFSYEVNNVYRRDEEAQIISEIKGKNMTLVFQDNGCTEFVCNF
jgi:predicted ATPase